MEKWQDLIHDCAESAWFIVYDAISYILDKIWQAFVALICFPIGMLGYVFDRLRTWVEKVSKFCLISSVSKENEMSRESDRSKKRSKIREDEKTAKTTTVDSP